MFSKLGVIVLSAAVCAASVATGSAGAAETLGVTLPSSTFSSSLTGGGPPNFADTFATPYVASEGGPVVSWKAQFMGGIFPEIPPYAEGPGVAAGIQLKIFRPVSPTVFQVVGAGAVHDPRPILLARLFAYPFFRTEESAIEFFDAGLTLQPGDRIGLTIMSDPFIGRYLYPLIGTGTTPIVLRNVPVGETIDLADIYTGELSLPPAIQVHVGLPVTAIEVDVKPGTFPNSINIGSNGTVPVAILSSASFDAATVDPLSVTLSGARVELRGRGTPMASSQDVNGDGLLDLVIHVSTEALELSDTDTEVVLEGNTFGGAAIRGTDSVRVIA